MFGAKTFFWACFTDTLILGFILLLIIGFLAGKGGGDGGTKIDHYDEFEDFTGFSIER